MALRDGRDVRGGGSSAGEAMVLARRLGRMPDRAFRAWDARRQEGAMPTSANFSIAEAGAFAEHCALIDVAAGPVAPAIGFLGAALERQLEPSAPMARSVALLIEQVRRRCADGAVRRAPHMFEVERSDARGAGHLCRGVLLPLAGTDGQPRAICCVLVVLPLARMDDRPDVRAVVGSVAQPARIARAASPWSLGSGAETLLRPCGGALRGDLPTARMWAALAAVGHPGRSRSLHAALGATCDLLTRAGQLSDREEQMARRADRAVTDVFGTELTPSDRRDYVAVIVQGIRLGLTGEGLAALLDRTPGGVAAVARAERAARCGRRATPFRAGRAGAALALLPIGDVSPWRSGAPEPGGWAFACPWARVGA